MAPIHQKRSLSFISLNLTQFFTALNDNLFKLLLIFFLISIKGQEHSNTILALAGFVFVVPFLLFASLAGSLADRYSKRSIIYFTRLIEILTTSFGVLAFFFKSTIGGYFVLFLMATLSTLFSPCKYGIIPEIVKNERVSHYNGLITATTYLAIILGTFSASFITEISDKNFVLASLCCVVIASLGAISSLGIEKTKPQAAQKKVSARFISDIVHALIKARSRRYLLTTIVFGAYFLFMGAYTQLNIIPFTLQSLHMTDVQGGYLFLMTAIGIGVGSFFAGQLSGKNIELGFVPLAAFGITFCFTGLYLLSSQLYAVIALLTLIGIFGGFFIVPIDAFIQMASPKDRRGQNIATFNFLSFVGVIFASLMIAFLGNLLNLTAAQGFLVIGIVTLILAFCLLFLYADLVLRFLIGLTSKIFWQLKISGLSKIRLSSPTLLIAPRGAWIDTLIIMATLPRLVRYIVPVKSNYRKRGFFYRLLRIIPIDIEHFAKIGPESIQQIENELKNGCSVCLMHPVFAESKNLKEWELNLKTFLQKTELPIIPVYISRKQVSEKAGLLNQFTMLFRHPMHVTYGPKIN